MTSYFPDINIWLAASAQPHSHFIQAQAWLASVGPQDQLIFSRFTQLGLLRLLTNASAMGTATQTLGEAWSTYDTWLSDPRVEFHPEPRHLEVAYREITAPFGRRPSPKAVADCFLIAVARSSGATLVTFDQALRAQAKKSGCRAMIPA